MESTIPTGPDDDSSPANTSGNERETAPQHDDERARLLVAATEVLQRNGWWGFKVESVLRQAGLSTRSFYRHFDKKSDLLLALLESEATVATNHIQHSVDAADTPSEKVSAYVKAAIGFAYQENLSKPSSLFASHWRDMIAEHPEAIERIIQRMSAPLEDAIRQGSATGEFDSADSVADTRTAFFLLLGITADQIAFGGVMPRMQVEQIVTPFINRAIGIT